MKKSHIINSALALCLTLSLPVVAGIQYHLDDFTKDPLSIGVVNVQDNTYLKTALHPDFNIAALEIGLDLNLYIPIDGSDVPEELQSLVVRRVAYDHQKWLGFEWGHLRRVNFGYGLIMDNYDSGSFGSEEFNADKAGFLGYMNVGGFGVQGMITASKVSAGRLTYTLENTFLLGAPVVFGGTYVKDDDGISETYGGTAVTRPSVEMYGGDVGVPLGGDFFTWYAEYAEIKDGNAGFSTGFKGDILSIAQYRLEYRDLEAGFVPAYFNSIYEATSFDPATDAPQESTTGILASAGSTFMDGHLQAGFQYESYDNQDTLLTAGFGWKRLASTAGVVNYKENFSASNDNGILNVDIRYYTGGNMDYVTHYKRVFLDNDQFTESYGMSFVMDLGNLLPF